MNHGLGKQEVKSRVLGQKEKSRGRQTKYSQRNQVSGSRNPGWETGQLQGGPRQGAAPQGSRSPPNRKEQQNAAKTILSQGGRGYQFPIRTRPISRCGFLIT